MPEEREYKADVAATFALPDFDGVAGLRAHDRGVRTLDATYWDTDSLELLRSGYGLRHRTTDGGHGLWTLKAGSHRERGAMVRDEVEVPGEPDRLPDELARRLRGVVPLTALHPVARLRTERHVVDLSAGDVRWAEVADDTVTVLRDADAVHRFREVEVELHGGADDRIEQVLASLRAAGARPSSASSKYVRALQALGHDVVALRDA